MNFKLTNTLVAICLTITTKTSYADSFPGIDKLMTESEFATTGLNKLNDEEIKALNQWLIKYTASEAPILKKTTRAVKEAGKKAIISQIKGDFGGWSGGTLFYLKNGQVWKQRHLDKYSIKLKNPNVKIKQNLLGFYMMRVEGADKAIGVERVK
jgi:hypothetical protein